MKEKEFKIIKTNLENRLNNCSKFLDHILSSEDLYDITIKEFIELRAFCKQELNDMTEILMVDLYHVLGMGKLTLIQRNIFLSLISKYVAYRSDMKCISSMKDIFDLARLPSKSKFKLHKLGDVTLESEARGSGRAVEVIDEVTTLSDYAEAKRMETSSSSSTFVYKSINVSEKTVTCDVSDAKEMIAALAPDSSVSNLFKRCDKHLTYCNILWNWEDSKHTKLAGEFLTIPIRERLIKNLKLEASKVKRC